MSTSINYNDGSLVTHLLAMRVLSPFRYSCPRSHKSSIASYSTSTPSSPLAGTVAYHRSYVFLHSHKPISEFPSKVNSPLQKALQLSLGRGVGLVNFSWSIDQPVHEKYAGIGDDSHQSEVYCATVFSAARGRLFLPEVSLDNLADVSRRLEEHTSVDERRRATTQSAEKVDKLHLYVCTHGTRDCRCGESGGEVIEALRKEVSSRDLMGRVSISEVAHVGGHK